MSRLIGSSLGSLGRGMAGVPEPAAGDEAMPDAPTPVEGVAGNGAGGAGDGKAGAAATAGGGGGKKKKKGKK